jgi:lipopolysaccharide export system protein LptA
MITGGLLVACVALLPIEASAQARGAPGGRCAFTFFKRYATEPRLAINTTPSGARHIFLGGGVRAVCAAQNITVIADSMESYEDTRITYLIGNVHYTEPRLTLDAARLTYWENEERLRAEVNVDATLPSGTNLKGPIVEYYRAARGLRERSRMIAPRRPTINIAERDSAGRASDPIEVIANTVVMEADSLVFASGDVVLTRPDMVARGDSAFVDNGREFARLMRGPVVEGKGERPFTLSGRVIDVHAQDRKLEHAIAIGEAKAVSDSTTITADTLDFRLVDAQLERAFAWGPTRARVTSPSYDVLADSLDVNMPDQRVERVYAVGQAFIESDADSTRFRSAERDWLRGDTIIAQFDTSEAARRDTSGVAITQLDAFGNARSFYQLAPRDTSANRPAINYVTGKSITILFDDRQVEHVAVSDRASGVYLEPGQVAAPPPGQRPPATPPINRPPTPPDAGRRPPAGTP